ncbi:MAG: hypothetical protein AAFX40_06995 [Cyanobacteria bacterium J06639_1]
MAPELESLQQQVAAAQAREQQLMAELERRPAWSEFEEVQQQFDRELAERPSAEQLQEAKRKQEIAEAHHLVLKRQHSGLQERVVELEKECAEARSYAQVQEREVGRLEAASQELEIAKAELKERLFAVERQNIQLKATLDKCLAECQEYRSAARAGIPTGEIAIPDGSIVIPTGEVFQPVRDREAVPSTARETEAPETEVLETKLLETELFDVESIETGRESDEISAASAIDDLRIQAMVAASAEHVAARLKPAPRPGPKPTATPASARPQVDLPAFVQRRPIATR